MKNYININTDSWLTVLCFFCVNINIKQLSFYDNLLLEHVTVTTVLKWENSVIQRWGLEFAGNPFPVLNGTIINKGPPDNLAWNKN